MVARVADEVVDGVDHGAIADLLEGDLPLVVALLPVHGDQGTGRSPVSQLAGVFNRPVEVLPAVHKQLTGHGFRVCPWKKKGKQYASVSQQLAPPYFSPVNPLGPRSA